MRIQFIENYEQYKKGEDHTVYDGLAQRLLEQGKAVLPRQADQKITMLPEAPIAAEKAKESKKTPKKKKAEGKSS